MTANRILCSQAAGTRRRHGRPAWAGGMDGRYGRCRQREIHSVATVTSSSSDGIGSTPMPGPVGTVR